MRPNVTLKHEFVEFIPDSLAPGTIYISIAYATVAHRCCCGCGHEVVTPLSPTDWKLVFDGESVSLDPSIGNWSFPCQSHYWIRRNTVQWAERWTREEVQAGRAHDAMLKDQQFKAAQSAVPPVANSAPSAPAVPRPSGWRRLAAWLRGGERR